MSDYGRVPIMDIEEIANETEKEVVNHLLEKDSKNGALGCPQDEPIDKKLKMKEHLARCREKSMEVRKANALEKKANKKPRGRPKKVIEDIKEHLLEKDKGFPQEENVGDDVGEVEIFTQPKKSFKKTQQNGVIGVSPINKVKKEPKQAIIKQEVIEPKDEMIIPPKSQNDLMIDMFSQFEDRMNKKFDSLGDRTQSAPINIPVPTPKQTPTPAPQQYLLEKDNKNGGLGFPQQDMFGFMTYMKQQEQMIRNEERTKITEELQQKKAELQHKNTSNYFKKLPQPNFNQPQDLTAPNMWDNLLNPKRRF